jgi:hypothetical protein
MSIDTDIIVETWSVLKEYIPEKDREKAGEHWIGILQDNGADRELLDALSEADDVLETPIAEILEEENYEEEDDEEMYED